MNFLLVEDEISKERNIVSFLQSHFGSAITISVARSINTAKVELKNKSFDYVLLDMTLPLFDNTDLLNSDSNEFDTFGGIAVLDEIDRRLLNSRVIVITAFDTLGQGHSQLSLGQITVDLKEEYPDNFIGSVYYNISSLTWKQNLERLITEDIEKHNESANS